MVAVYFMCKIPDKDFSISVLENSRVFHHTAQRRDLGEGGVGADKSYLVYACICRFKELNGLCAVLTRNRVTEYTFLRSIVCEKFMQNEINTLLIFVC